MLKKISVEIPVGIKMFGKPIRNGEINLLNLRQVFGLIKTGKVRKIYEYNEDETKRVELNMYNYKDEIDFTNVPYINDTKEEVVNKTVTPNPEVKPEKVAAPKPVVTQVKEEPIPVAEAVEEKEVESTEIPAEAPVEETGVAQEPTNNQPVVEEEHEMTEEELEALIAAEETAKVEPVDTTSEKKINKGKKIKK